MKLVLALMLLSTSAIAVNKKSWEPKYEKRKLEELKNKVKPIKSKTKTKATKEIAYKPKTKLEALYFKRSNKSSYLGKLKAETLKLKQKAVPTLINVMKSSHFPDENKWVATYMLGRIMGVKSAVFISKFTKHPSWMMRLASLKVLLHLQQKQFKGIYTRLLEDKSLIVRHQALQNIREMKLTGLAPYVWKMLYNKENYVGTKGERKRANIIKEAIKIVGELGFKKAKTPMLKMMQKSKYEDVHAELDYSLSKLHKKESPKGALSIKKNFWNKVALTETTI